MFTKMKQRVTELLTGRKVSNEDLMSLSVEERAEFRECIQRLFDEAEGDERDDLYNRMEGILTSQTRNEMWEYNHSKILDEITRFVDTYGRMPSKMELSSGTGLSRQTINKHFKEYRTHPLFVEHMEQFEFMGQRVLSKMLKLAIGGDVKAGRLYFDIIGAIKPSKAQNDKPRGFVRIRNMMLSQEVIMSLDPSHLAKIEEILREARIGNETEEPPLEDAGN
jgi:hypothetical protein